MIRLFKSAVLLGLLVALACGDDDGGGNNTVDAGPRPDADDTDADVTPTVGTCGVVTYGEGVSVVFSNPDGSIIGTETTDVDGKASRTDCVQGTMLTVAYNFAGGFSSDWDLTTIAGVNPGDTVMMGGEGGMKPSSLYADLNVATSADVSAFPGAAFTVVQLGCTGSDNDIGVLYNFTNLSPSCLGTDSNVDVLALLYDEGENPVAYAMQKDVPITQGAPGNNAQNLVTLGAWTALSSPLEYAFTVSNPPAGAEINFVGMGTAVDFAWFNGDQGGTEVNPVDTFTIEGLPSDFGELSAWSSTFITSGADIFYGINPAVTFTGVTGYSSYTDTVQLDAAATVLPRVVAMVVTSEEVSRPVINWFVNGSMAEADGFMAGFFYGPISDGPRGQWIVLAPAGSETSFKLPALPDALADAAPKTDDVITPIAQAFWDASWASFSDFITTPGMNPYIFFEPYNFPPLPNLLDITLRRSAWVGFTDIFY